MIEPTRITVGAVGRADADLPFGDVLRLFRRDFIPGESCVKATQMMWLGIAIDVDPDCDDAPLADGGLSSHPLAEHYRGVLWFLSLWSRCPPTLPIMTVSACGWDGI